MSDLRLVIELAVNVSLVSKLLMDMKLDLAGESMSQVEE